MWCYTHKKYMFLIKLLIKLMIEMKIMGTECCEINMITCMYIMFITHIKIENPTNTQNHTPKQPNPKTHDKKT